MQEGDTQTFHSGKGIGTTFVISSSETDTYYATVFNVNNYYQANRLILAA